MIRTGGAARLLRGRTHNLLVVAVVAVVLAGSLLLGGLADRLPVRYILAAVAASILALVALQNMTLSLTLLVAAAALVPFSIGTGTQSAINAAMMLVALLTAVWVLRMVGERRLHLAPSPVNLPLLLFACAACVSWLTGFVISNPFVRLPGNILVVQAGQMAVFLLSIAALLLVANHDLDERTLKQWTAFIVIVGVVIVFVEGVAGRLRPSEGWTGGLYVWPFLLFAAQLLFNKDLDRRIRLVSPAVFGLWLYWVVTWTLGWKSSWVPTFIGFGLLLAWRRAWWVIAASGLVVLAVFFVPPLRDAIGTGLLLNEQNSAGPIRWTLWVDVFKLGAQSAIFGLGPANYRYFWSDPHFVANSYQYVNPYAFTRTVYAPPAHNMFADIFAQTGIVGLVFFVWALIAIVVVGWRLTKRPLSGFLKGYVYGVLAGLVSLIIASFVFAEWLMPYVYNLGLVGFRHSVYAWLLAGTLISLERTTRPAPVSDAPRDK